MANGITSGINVFKPEEFKGVEKMVTDLASNWQQKNLIEQGKINKFNQFIQMGAEGILNKDRQEILGQRKALEDQAMQAYKAGDYMPSAEDQMALNQTKSDVLRQIELSKKQAKEFEEVSKLMHMHPEKYDTEFGQKGLAEWVGKSIGERGDIYENVKLRFNQYEPFENKNIIPALDDVEGNKLWNPKAKAKAREDIDSWMNTDDGQRHMERWMDVKGIQDSPQAKEQYKQDMFNIYQSKIREVKAKDSYWESYRRTKGRKDAEAYYKAGDLKAAFNVGIPKQDENGNFLIKSATKDFQGKAFTSMAHVDFTPIRKDFWDKMGYGGNVANVESADVMIVPNNEAVSNVKAAYPNLMFNSYKEIALNLGINNKAAKALFKIYQQSSTPIPQSGGVKDSDVFIDEEDFKALQAATPKLKEKFGEDFEPDQLVTAVPYVFYNKEESTQKTTGGGAKTVSTPMWSILDEEWIGKMQAADETGNLGQSLLKLQEVAKQYNTPQEKKMTPEEQEAIRQKRFEII